MLAGMLNQITPLLGLINLAGGQANTLLGSTAGTTATDGIYA